MTAQKYVIRPVRADEWEKVKELRLAALQDPVAPIAFLETYEKASAQPDSFWQGRTERGAESGTIRQFVAEGPDGTWVGSVTVLVEVAGAGSVLDDPIEVDQGHVVGVYVRPEHRGTGVIESLFEAGVEWAWQVQEPRLERVRLFVHEDNRRAAAFYERFGFRPSGVVVPIPDDPAAKELEYVLPRP
ncbi:GNAT family N-acetyltransferase [Streptomyces antimicrobicus]|uniref:GNAT family N-acetyltransferase n=1 Tax=Streptomyces antimicrobicus TaxID=2883108 RepID=A0ABS8BCV2_9ACTN|nr:GNAT family N-acetyltransferase [Streptomyces antimicrobicus]MCB5182426.1 GNAT family N-acetyltransferase [Streptomyces antimicrobicus]